MSEGVHHLPRLGISSAMRLYSMTARALRFYEERGLVEARRDRLNCRFYDETARGRLEWISRLREVGLSLPDVRAVLDAETPAARRAEAIARVNARLHALQRDTVAATVLLNELSDTGAPVRRAL